MTRFVVHYLTTSEVRKINRYVIDEHGGDYGVLNPGLLDSAVHSPQTSYAGEEMYPSVFDKAASYLIHIACNHAFNDGNKRTGWFACVAFLRMNGYRIKPRRKAMVEFVEGVGSGANRDWMKVSEWLARHSERV